MNDILLALPKSVPHTACVDARDLKTHIGDNVHFDTAAQNEIGKRLLGLLPERLLGFWRVDAVEPDAHLFAVLRPNFDGVAIGLARDSQNFVIIPICCHRFSRCNPS